jgi:tetratricopeptide (TPR) repeat protein
MKAMPILIATVLLTARPAAGQAPDRGKLRAAAYLPSVTHTAQLASADLFRRGPDGKKIDFAVKAAELRQRLAGTPADAQGYLDLAECYACVNDQGRRVEAAGKAEELLRPRLQTSDSADGPLLAAYCEALIVLRPKSLKEREQWARRAVKLAPGDWRCWFQLGSVREPQLYSALYGGEEKVPIGDSFQQTLPDLARLRPPAAALDEADRCLQEARECYGNVRALAPRDPKALAYCYQFGVMAMMETNLLAALRGRPAQSLPSREASGMRDVFALAELLPGSMPAQAQAGMWEVSLGLVESAGAPPGPDGLPQVPAECRQRLQKFLDRLAKGAENPNAEAEAYCHRCLASLWTRIDFKEAEKHARRAVTLDAGLRDMWEMLAVGLYMRGEPAEALEIFRSCLKRFPDARSHYMFAKGLALSGKLAEAEEVLRAGLKAEPDDPFCNLGLAAVLMRQGDRAEALTEAGQRLGSARVRLGPNAPPQLTTDLDALTVVFEGLQGRPERGLSLLRQVLARGPETAELRQIREALGP